ncbi:MAG: TIGR03013 family PEP-CTERM/XrtA system glycosyltransferase [Planctomycetes bacterium]|nr:TIGR03013 family PEP-CTERM/XrtA system glycosyltransferase [Planctomycetota bacterium]
MFRLFRHYIPSFLFALLTADLGVILGAILLSRSLGGWIGEGTLWPKVVSLSAIVLFALYLADLYKTDSHLGRRELTARLLLAVACGAILVAAASFAVPALRFGRLAFVQIFGFLAAGLLVSRLAWMEIHSNERLRKRVLVLGVSRAAQRLVDLQANGSRPFRVLGFLDDDPGAHEKLPSGSDLLGKSKDLLNIVEELQPDLVLVALPDMRGAFPATDLLECRLAGIQVEDWPTFYEKQTGKILVTDLRPSWLIFSDGFVKTHLTQTLKRAVDVVLAVAGLALSLPVMGLIAVATKMDSRGPALFRQERVGQGGRIFVLNKFRSMHVDAEQGSWAVWATQGDSRVTRLGRVLRRTRLDELPQLFNVLMGDMSFIGPRPERPEFVRLLRQQIPFYMERLSVKPGITGWAQVRHRYAASVEDTLEKLQYDLYYIKNLSPFLDLLILLNTIQVVLFARGAR